MPIKQEITVNDVLEFKNVEKVLFASDIIGTYSKHLYLTLYGGYEVYKNKSLVKQCSQPFDAVECYNAISF